MYNAVIMNVHIWNNLEIRNIRTWQLGRFVSSALEPGKVVLHSGFSNCRIVARLLARDVIELAARGVDRVLTAQSELRGRWSEERRWRMSKGTSDAVTRSFQDVIDGK